MNTQMMEGLMGATSNLRLSGTPMSVYRQASAEGDTEKMKRAMSYTGECVEKAVKSQEKLDEGMKAEAKEKREQAKLEQEAAIEKRREERRKAEEDAAAEGPRETDRVQLSEAAKAALKDCPAEPAAPEELEPVIYTPSGKTAPPAETEPTACFTA